MSFEVVKSALDIKTEAGGFEVNSVFQSGERNKSWSSFFIDGSGAGFGRYGGYMMNREGVSNAVIGIMNTTTSFSTGLIGNNVKEAIEDK